MSRLESRRPQQSLDRIADAVTRACVADPKVTDEIVALGELASGAPPCSTPIDRPVVRDLLAEFVTRFQQTCGPVMAKGVEDTAFYRYHRLIALNEVGGDPGGLRHVARGVPRCFPCPAGKLALRR